MTTEDMFAFPPSFAQQRLWILEQLQPGSAIYNIPWTIDIKGPVDVPALHQALQALVDRHETLRTTFATVDGTPVQVVAETLPIALPAVDLTQHEPVEREAESQRLIGAEAQRPFDLVAGPLLRGLLIKRAADEHVLLLTMHHLIFDAWSRDVFFQELATLYAACARSIDPTQALPALPIQYADYAVWQREWLSGDVLEQQLSYWKHQLGPEGAPAPALTELPTDRSRPAVQTFRGAQHALSVPSSVQDSLAALSQQEGVTLFMTLLAAFKTLLYHYTDQQDIVVGSPIANRPRPETAGLIGFFVNMLVLRSDLSGNPTFREVLQRVRETALSAYAHQELPFEKLVEELAPDRSLNYTPLFQIVFSLHSAAAAVKESGGLELRIGDVGNGTSKFDLTLNMLETESGLSGVFVYNPDLFDAATIERMAGHFTTLLAQIAAQPDAHVSGLSLLTPAERVQLLPSIPAPAADPPLVPKLVAAWAARTPEALAVACGA
ncbi:MAG TPA: condensation domain-containing protein, partial [Herpetosiphonaceae bacterium]